MSEETVAVVEDVAPPCRNCGAPAPGAYCPRCGQETQARLPKFTQFMREAAGRYVALDGRLWKTLGALLFRPGFLTREYLAGRRRRYIRPARLFLVASLALFAVLRIYVEMQEADVVQLDSKERAEISGQSAPKAGSDADKGVEDDGKFHVDDDLQIDMAMKIPALRHRIDRFKKLPGPEKEAQIVDGIFRYGPYAMFVLLPAFAFLLEILYLGRKRRHPARPRLYAEHLVFAAHNTAFLSLGIIAATLAPYGLLRAIVIVWMVVYLLWSMRAVYAGSWLGIVARASAIVLAYSVLFGLVTAGLVIAAIVLR